MDLLSESQGAKLTRLEGVRVVGAHQTNSQFTHNCTIVYLFCLKQVRRRSKFKQYNFQMSDISEETTVWVKNTRFLLWIYEDFECVMPL